MIPTVDFLGVRTHSKWGRASIPQRVYVIGPVSGWPCKIGISAAPAKRLGELQVGCWEELKVHSEFLVSRPVGRHENCAQLWWEMNGLAERVEALVKSGMKEHGLHLRGEWYDLAPDEAAEVVERVAEKMRVALIGDDGVLCGDLSDEDKRIIALSMTYLADEASVVGAVAKANVAPCEERAA